MHSNEVGEEQNAETVKERETHYQVGANKTQKQGVTNNTHEYERGGSANKSYKQTIEVHI